MHFLKIAVIALAMSLGIPAVAQDAGTSNMAILRDKLKADKKLVVAANMQLTDAEARQFWPIYEAYQGELKRLNSQLGLVIKTYADAYTNEVVTSAVAKTLVTDAIKVEEAETRLKRTYFPKIEAAVGAIKAARYLQIENKIRAVVKYELAEGIPLVR